MDKDDNRIIDLDSDDSKLPPFFQELKQPINMTMCAGDGVQGGKITDIESFTTGKKEHDRENKPTTIFITTKNYQPGNLEKNKEYLRRHPKLQVILLVYNHETPKWKENLVRLFPESINNIYEDMACYADKLDLKTLYEILREDGTYQMTRYLPTIDSFMAELHFYKNYWEYFTINLQNVQCTITKNNGNVLFLPSEWKITYSDYDDTLMNEYNRANGLQRFHLDALDYKYRTEAKAKHNRGGKKKKTKKSRKNKKSKKTIKAKKMRKP
jgi:hypothetical protein